MNYPFWDVPHLGSGWVIGLIAIFHVMISHFAVGGGFYLVLAETKARREKRADWLQVLQGHSKFFLILTGVFGAVTGVGIWFAIGLANPEATSALIHNFVFGWAIEWVFFMVELTTAAVYYYTWDRIPASLHIKVGWVYAIASFFTLFIINGILTFMLTPGQAWLAVAGTGMESSRFVQAFFNPLFWPSLFLRMLACASLAGVWALVTCARLDGEKFPQMKADLLRWSSRWIIPSFALLPFCFAWFLWNVPAAQLMLLQLGISNVGPGAFSQLTRTVLIIPLSSASVVGVVYLFVWRSPLEVKMRHAATVVLLALFATASTEYGREMLRKPYVIGQYMFSNGVRAKAVSLLNTNGYLDASLWTRPVSATATAAEQQLAKGEAVFRGQCAACHTRDAYRSMKRLVGERNREGIVSVLKMLHDYDKDSPYRKYMPPLVGHPDEIAALGDYLASLTHKPGKTAAPSTPSQASSTRRKRQRAAALQDLRRQGALTNSLASWSAAALCRFQCHLGLPGETDRRGIDTNPRPPNNRAMNSRIQGLIRAGLLGALVLQVMIARAFADTTSPTNGVKVVNGVVMPRQPVAQAIDQAMQFLKKADGGYVPGRIDGELAGYFTSAFVNPDGTRSSRTLSYPARQHAYFIITFLHYHAYTGQKEWLTRARDLGDWNLAHSTPSSGLYSNLPYSTMSNGKTGGSRDGDSIEPDKAAFLGSAYLALYDTTTDKKYLTGARAVAATLVQRQREDGGWPFRVVPSDGTVQQDLGGAPVFFVQFFEGMLRHDIQPAYQVAHDKALKYMLRTNVEKNSWGTYHEDVRAKAEGYLSAEPMSFTADYLFRHGKEHPEYLEMGRTVLKRMEDKLVHTTGHPAAPAPAVAEQAGFNHMMPGHTARYCLALAHLYALTHDEQVKRKTLSGINALTYMQSPAGLFRTFFYSVNPKAADANRPDWYSQHLYTVCHVLEVMAVIPEVAPRKGP